MMPSRLPIKRIPGGWAAVFLVSVPEGDCFSAVQRIRDEIRSVYVQVIDSDSVLNVDHILLSLQNVISAHRHGYNKMNRVDSELLLVMAGINHFEVAVKMMAPKADGKAVLISFSDREEDVVKSTRLFELYAGTRAEEPMFRNDLSRLLRLSAFYQIPPESLGRISEDVLTEALAERSAVFYAKYR